MIGSRSLREMMKLGLTPEQMLALVEALEADAISLTANDDTVPTPPSPGALRTRRYRDRKQASQGVTNSVTVTPPSVTCDDDQNPPNEYISNPPEKPLSPKGDPSLSTKSQIETLVSEWNGMAGRTGLPSIRGPLAGTRLSSARARIAEHGLGGCREALAAVERSPFCRGETTDWKADFKFFVRPDNFVKLIEGGYDPPQKHSQNGQNTGLSVLLAQAQQYRPRTAA